MTTTAEDITAIREALAEPEIACFPDFTKAVSSVLAELDRLKVENERMREALRKINDIRNSIIGFQKMNWSEHIYPLVGVLEDAGIAGAGYPESRTHVGTMLERTLLAENAVIAKDTVIERMRQALEFYASPSNWINTPPWDDDPECISEKAIPVLPEEGRPCDCGDTARSALKGDTHGD